MRGNIEGIGSGDHAALFYRTRAEQFASAIPYIQIGLARGERCYYIADTNSLVLVLQAMEEAGIDVAKEQATGALTVATKHETYIKHGIFEPEKMIADLKSEVIKSLEMGYPALRATGEMTWALELPSALEQFYHYETLLDREFPSRLVGLCQYHEPSFEPKLLAHIIRTHRKVIIGGRAILNPFYAPRKEEPELNYAALSELLEQQA